MKTAFYLIWLSFLTSFSVENRTVLKVKIPVEDVFIFKTSSNVSVLSAPDSLVVYAEKFNQLNTQIRDGKAVEVKSKVQVAQLLSLLKRYYLQQKNSSDLIKKYFPVAGYNYKAIGGSNGSGYLPKGYNYYHGNQHKGHPAHDIFVLDKDQNNLDDKTGKPVKILSVSEGIVIATESYWQPGSPLRGGVYVWIYNPKEDLLYYYAHNQQLFVKPGDVLKAGQEIATMGRSGLNAYKKRSSTHLHYMTLKVLPQGQLQPVNPYQTLSKL